MALKETGATGDIAAHRLSPEQLSCEFADIAPLLDPTAAAAAASRRLDDDWETDIIGDC